MVDKTKQIIIKTETINQNRRGASCLDKDLRLHLENESYTGIQTFT